MPLLCRLGFHDWSDFTKKNGEFFWRYCFRCDVIEWRILPPDKSSVFYPERNGEMVTVDYKNNPEGF